MAVNYKKNANKTFVNFYTFHAKEFRKDNGLG